MSAAPRVCLATVFKYVVCESQELRRKIPPQLPRHLVSSGPPCRLWEGWQMRREGEREEPFVSLTMKVQIAARYVSQMVLTAAFCTGGPQGKGRTRNWNSIDMTCVIRALIFKMVIYCCRSSKHNSLEDHHWDVKLFSFLGRSHYFINHCFFLPEMPFVLGFNWRLGKETFTQIMFSESFQISCITACILGTFFFALQYYF